MLSVASSVLAWKWHTTTELLLITEMFYYPVHPGFWSGV
jgi:hypothetical protein